MSSKKKAKAITKDSSKSCEENIENTKYIDLLDEDKPISGQKFVCLSFISPENIIKNKELFYFNEKFFVKFIKIIIASILMGLFFNFLLNFFQNELAFNQSIKSLYLVLSVILGLLFYLIVCYFIKAFQMNDIKLKY